MLCRKLFLLVYCVSLFPLSASAAVLLEDSNEFSSRAGRLLRSISTIDEVPIGTVIPWPVGDGTSEGFEVPSAWRICNGQPLQTNWYNKLPTWPEDLRTKWYTHASTVIGSNLPKYNVSTVSTNKGVFLRGNTGATAQYMVEQGDTFRSHNHGQPKHGHPFDFEVVDNQVAGGFEGQGYVDAVNRFYKGSAPLLTGITAKTLAHIQKGYGGESGLSSTYVISKSLSSAHIATVPSVLPHINAQNARYTCEFHEEHSARITTDIKETDSYAIKIDMNKGGKTNFLQDDFDRPAAEGTYAGKVNDKTVTGKIFEAGGEDYDTNDNDHGGTFTRNEQETAPAYMNVMYIIKVLP